MYLIKSSLVLACLVVAACGEDGGDTVTDPGPYQLTFTPQAMMERGTVCAVHYWIDSNIGGGTLGVCDPTTFDHQWSVEFFSPTNDVNFNTSYQPGLTEYICNTFA